MERAGNILPDNRVLRDEAEGSFPGASGTSWPAEWCAMTFSQLSTVHKDNRVLEALLEYVSV